jgi:hypothetical protein
MMAAPSPSGTDSRTTKPPITRLFHAACSSRPSWPMAPNQRQVKPCQGRSAGSRLSLKAMTDISSSGRNR